MSYRAWIKICGLTRLEDVELCAREKVDAVGFNFVRESPRYISPIQAAELSKSLPDGIERVGVFVNSSRSEVAAIAAESGITTLQFHGDEPDDILHSWESFEVIRALRVENAKLVTEMLAKTSAKRIIVDAYSKDIYGGTGKRLSAEVLSQLSDIKAKQVIISGGLNPLNVAGIVAEHKPYGVDAASGVEISPGIKDEKLLCEFVEAVRKA